MSYAPSYAMGYPVIYKGKLLNNVRIHPIVAKCFPEVCGEWFDGCCVHHIDHNRSNNIATNLQVMSLSAHMRLHMEEDGVTKTVTAYDREGNIVNTYDSMMDAERETGVSYAHISAVCKGKRKSAGGMFWCYAGSSDGLEGWVSGHYEKELARQDEIYRKICKRVKRYERNNKSLEARLRRAVRWLKKVKPKRVKAAPKDVWKSHNVCVYDKLKKEHIIYRCVAEVAKVYKVSPSSIYYGIKRNGYYADYKILVTKSE